MADAIFDMAGEILIIVVGVLLAIAVENWRQGRADRRSETRLLQGLASDLEQDANHLQEFKNELVADVEATHTLLKVIKGDELPDPSRFAQQLIQAAAGYEPVYSIATYTELASGNFHLVRNGELRRKVIRYYSNLTLGERASGRTTPQAWYDPGIEPFFLALFEILPPGDWLAWLRGEPANLDVAATVTKLKAYPGIDGYLEASLRGRALQISKYTGLEQDARQLHEAILAEIGDNG